MIDGTQIATIADSVARAFNLVLYGSGGVFIIMILWSAYKYAMSLGDAKSLEGAKQSLTQSIFGFLIILGFLIFFSVTAGYLGLDENVVKGPASIMRTNLQKLEQIVNNSGNDLVIPCAQKGFCVLEGED
ncbi:hypothetical protein HYV31_02860 [candidate division WWE3 bacterium]|nr:hypothetical protein [candidate division WWE3 bacterium]